MRLATKWVASFCLLLTLWAAAAEPVHQHSDDINRGSCSLCVVAHSTAPTAVSHSSEPTFVPVGVLEADAVSNLTRLAVNELGNRGPPSLL